MHVYDARNIGEPTESIVALDRPIYRLKLRGNSLGVIGHTNQFKVYDISDRKFVLRYENDAADDYVRDICWIDDSKALVEKFITVGYNSNIKCHQMK